MKLSEGHMKFAWVRVVESEMSSVRSALQFQKVCVSV